MRKKEFFFSDGTKTLRNVEIVAYGEGFFREVPELNAGEIWHEEVSGRAYIVVIENPKPSVIRGMYDG